MTRPPGAPGGPQQPPDRADRTDRADPSGPDPELLLGQALRAMAGGGRAPLPNPDAAAGSGADDRCWSRFSTLQILLMAALAGLILGVVAGLLSLLL